MISLEERLVVASICPSCGGLGTIGTQYQSATGQLINVPCGCAGGLKLRMITRREMADLLRDLPNAVEHNLDNFDPWPGSKCNCAMGSATFHNGEQISNHQPGCKYY